MRSSPIRLALLSVMLVIAVGACGCPATNVRDAAARQRRMNIIRDIGLAYLNHRDSVGKAPADAADLQKFTEQHGPDVTAALTDGSFTFIYGVTPDDMGKQKGASRTVVGYDAEFAKDKGFVIVLMGGASVEYVTADQFKSMPKAEPPAN
jgi:hypothetical protein